MTDTYFVSKLGLDSLAAMGFTFPVVMTIGAVSGGISLGAGSCLARAYGGGDHHKMHRIATDGILLSVVLVFIVSMLGIWQLDNLFTLLGAKGTSFEQATSYMRIWYMGAFVIIVPPVSDSAMRALGDMVRPFFVMLTCAIGNLILDPILIFGYFGLPAMGIRGAALATVISRTFGMALTLSFVIFKYKLIDFKYENINELLKSWKEILMIGVPNVFVRIIPQLLRGLMTKLAADMTMGTMLVAAIAAGQRIESFATVFSMAISVSIMPIVGQNFGAKNMTRVMEARKLLIRFSLIYGILMFLLMLPLGKMLGGIFADDIQVREITANYLRLIMIGTVGLNWYNFIGESFNAVAKPRYSMIINVLGTITILMPLLFIGSKVMGFEGMLAGLVIGQWILGIIAIRISKNRLI